MATPPAEVRSGLEELTAAATAQIALAAADTDPSDLLDVLSASIRLALPPHFDAAASLAVAWYDELRAESDASTEYAPYITTDPNSDWIERELRKVEAEVQRTTSTIEAEILADIDRLTAEAEALTQKEVARGFRDTIDGNATRDPESIGWSRHTRGDACKFCQFLARDSAVYRSERTARFAAHTDCHCLARPEFANGAHGPEADVLQYVASQRKRTAKERAALRDYLNQHYPDARG